jgi:hypothetical protein
MQSTRGEGQGQPNPRARTGTYLCSAQQVSIFNRSLPLHDRCMYEGAWLVAARRGKRVVAAWLPTLVVAGNRPCPPVLHLPSGACLERRLGARCNIRCPRLPPLGGAALVVCHVGPHAQRVACSRSVHTVACSQRRVFTASPVHSVACSQRRVHLEPPEGNTRV